MKIAIHQPNYLPYLGFFDKMNKADIFVIYDDAQFNKEDFHHRNKIRIYQGWKWLTIPVDKRVAPINEIKIRNDVGNWKGINWTNAHFNEIKNNYKNTPYYKNYDGEIKKIYENMFAKLIDLNVSLIMLVKRAFNINTKIIFSSNLINKGEVDPTSRSSERLIEIVKALSGDVYLSGPAGRDYLDVSQFGKNGIKVEFQDFKHPVYKQHYDEFISNMAAIDALFNIGELPK
jgi:hypothetical protein